MTDAPRSAPPSTAASTPEVTVPDYREAGLRDGMDGLRDLMDRLLDPEHGCPWDKAQTLDTLRPYLLEEAHEVLEAMHDPGAHRTELGDLLFQVVFQSALRERQGHFDLEGVIEAIRSKMLRRHPHVFGTEEQRALSADEVARQWAAIKEAERGSDGPADPLGGVPKGLPALQRAWRLQDKAAHIGFDWPTIDGALAKVREEWDELEQARAEGTPEQVAEEFGDLLFVMVRVGQKLGIEAEDALRSANAKFERRFAGVMQRCHEKSIDPSTAGLEVLDGFWNEAKAQERQSTPPSPGSEDDT
ncbi:MAG: nucleoside triphosphate pyrophosphohydrolase [Myxococcota bacterium]